VDVRKKGDKKTVVEMMKPKKGIALSASKLSM